MIGGRLFVTAVVWVVGFALLRLSLLAPEVCPSVDAARAWQAAVAAGTWIEAGQQADGRFLYEYDRTTDEAGPGYNIVRHAGVTLSLYQLVGAGDRSFLEPADAGLRWMLDRLVPAGGGVAFVEPGLPTASLGASALMTAALAARRDATGSDRYDGEARGLARFMMGQMGPGGRMLSLYDLAEERAVPGVTSRYATGEAGWALATLHNLLPGEGWDRPARRVADYLALERDAAEGLDYRPWPDQWAAYLLAEMAHWGLDEHHVAYARDLSERFGMLLRVESQKGGWPVPFVDPTARGAGLGVWAEGAGSLARLAAVDGRLADLRGTLEQRLACGAGVMAERQVDDAGAARFARPRLVEGAWFREDVTRMDDQQHALSGLLAAAGRIGSLAP